MAYLTFYNPYRLANRDESTDSAYERLAHRYAQSGHCGCNQVPAANISETDTEYRIELALPGVEKKNINVKHENGFLYVNVNEKEETAEKHNRFEFDYSGASRIFKTGELVDADRISASYENGILTLSLPKKEAFVNKPAQSIVVN
jgi:HSP20 family protein